MIYLILMTLTGSILFVFYLAWSKMFKGHVDARMRFVVLKIVLLAHVIPLMGLNNIYSKLLKLLLPQPAVQGDDLLVSMAEVSTTSEDYVTPNYRWMMLILLVWIILAVLLLLRQCIIYLWNMHKLRKLVDACRSEMGTKIAERLRKEFHLRRRVDVLYVEEDRSPYTTGMFKPVIILTREFTEEELEWVLRHEMTHIRRWDVAFSLLMELVCCLYWINPILYGFKKHYTDVCELSCDEKVVNGRAEDERTFYAKVLVKCASPRHGMTMSNALADKNKKVHERINKLMNSRKMKRWEKIIAVSAFVVFMLVDSTVALAYPNVYHVEDETDASEAVIPVAAGSGLWINSDSSLGYCKPIFEVLYDEEFIDENGTITPINLNQPLVFCIGHDWIQGYIQTHEKSDDGGCTVKVFNAKRCPYCNTIIIESLYTTQIFVTCPH